MGPGFRVGATFALAALFACSNVTVSDQYRAPARFTRYRLYAWVSEPSGAQTGAMDPATDKMMRDAIESELDSRRIELARAGQSPDFVVRYQALLGKQPSSGGPGLDYPQGGSQSDPFARTLKPGPSDFVHDEAHLKIEFLDAKKKIVFWSGEGTEVVDQDALTPIEIGRIVKKILARYPVSTDPSSRPVS